MSKNKVHTNFYNEENIWNNHVELGIWADIIIVAPATANTISKISQGACDNLLLAVILSARCPVFIAPAMDHDMYLNKITQKNISILKKNNYNLIDVDSGSLASGLSGEGRLKEPEKIISILESFCSNQKPLSGLNCLVTAGPTFEKIDPVRYIGNFSSGKMGCCIANELQKLGANVNLIIGPSSEKVDENMTVNRVVSSKEMYDLSLKNLKIKTSSFSPLLFQTLHHKKIIRKKLRKQMNSIFLLRKQMIF